MSLLEHCLQEHLELLPAELAVGGRHGPEDEEAEEDEA